MSLIGEQVLLRVYLQSADRTPHVPTYQRIIQAAREQKLAGTTVLRGISGVGYHGLLKDSAWSIVKHEPIILEIVDNADTIARFVQGPLNTLMIDGMLTLERAHVMMYRHRKHAEPNHLQLGREVKPLSTTPSISTGSNMQTNENGILLRVFIGESDKFDGKPLYEVILQKVRELGLAGATVLRGSEGFGANSIVHKSDLLQMSTDLPIVIEIVDSQDRINSLLPHLEKMVQEGMITMENVVVLFYRHNPADGAAA